MRLFILAIAILYCSAISFSQLDFFIGPGYGVSYNISRYDRLQSSYDSYLQSIENSNPGIEYEADPNFDSKQFTDFLSFHFGASFDGGFFSFNFMPNTTRQTRTVMFPNNYGRKFVFSDRRYEFLFDIGYGSKKVDVFGSFGVNMNKYRMVSYSIYPDGSASLTNEYYYNGVYKNFDAGLSYGLGVNIKPIQFLAIELRYIYAHNKFPGENTDLVPETESLTDYSDAKAVGSETYPADYTLGFYGENRLTPNFSQHYLCLSLVFHLDSDKLFKKNDSN